MELNWNTITVGQFQDVQAINARKDISDSEKVELIISALFNLTLEQINNMRITEFKELVKKIEFVLGGDIPGKPVKVLKVGRKKFAICYEPAKLAYRQYVEVMEFGKKPIENMHRIMASIVQPVTWFGKRLNNDSDKHAEVSELLQGARLIDIYHTCVFFCKLYKVSIRNIAPSLKAQMMREKKMTEVEAEAVVQALWNSTDSFIMPG